MNERSERWLDETVGPENKSRFLNSAQTLKERALENGTIFKGENSEMDENKEVEVLDQEAPEITTEVETEAQPEVEGEVETEVVEVEDAVDIVALKENTEANFEQVAESLLQINKELNERIDGLVARIDELTETTKEVSDIVTDNQKSDAVPFASFAAMMADRRTTTNKEETPTDNTVESLAEELLKETPAEPVIEKASRPFVLAGLS